MNNNVTGEKDDKGQIEPEYKLRGYDDMLLDCRTSIYRAVELVPQLYKWLRLIGKYTHKEAIAKMSIDLGDLPGFSRRTMRRYLPNDVPNVPRRIRPSWPKNSDTNIQTDAELSTTERTVALPITEDINYSSKSPTTEELTKIEESDSPQVRLLKDHISVMYRLLAEQDRGLALTEEVSAAKSTTLALKGQLIAAYKISGAQYKELIAGMNEETAIKDRMLATSRQFFNECKAILSKPGTK